MSHANLDGADLRMACLVGANFSEASLREARLSGANVNGVGPSRVSRPEQRNFGPTTFRGANLSGADLRRVDLTGVDLSEATLTGTMIDEPNQPETRTNPPDGPPPAVGECGKRPDSCPGTASFCSAHSRLIVPPNSLTCYGVMRP